MDRSVTGRVPSIRTTVVKRMEFTFGGIMEHGIPTLGVLVVSTKVAFVLFMRGFNWG